MNINKRKSDKKKANRNKFFYRGGFLYVERGEIAFWRKGLRWRMTFQRLLFKDSISETLTRYHAVSFK